MISDDEWHRDQDAVDQVMQGAGLGSGYRALDAEALAELGERLARTPYISVEISHGACDPDGEDSGSYYAPLADMHDFDGLMGWIAHLTELRWFGKTEMYKVLRRFQAAQRGIPASELRRDYPI